MLDHIFDCQNSKYDPSENVRGYYFSTVNLLAHISVTKIRVHSLINTENLSRTTLHQTDICLKLSLGAPAIH